MLTSIGKFSKSFFLKLLVGIIILPFVFWGMGDLFRGGNQNIIATIDSEKVTSQEFMQYLNRLNLSEEDRKNISKTDLLDKILSEYIGKRVVDSEIEQFGINISDQALKNIITNEKNFFKNGKFSRTEYEKFLLKSSVTAYAFEQNLIAQEKRRQLISFLSDGLMLPDFIIENEFKKENQLKEISYIDLNNYYKSKTENKDEINKVYEENKDLFIEVFKTISYIELKPETVTGKKEYDEAFFEKINELENDILDGKKASELSKVYNFPIKKTEEISSSKLNSKDLKYDENYIKLFKKIFSKELNYSELINIDNKYYLTEISGIRKKQLSISDKKVIDTITNQINLKNIFEGNSKLAKEIYEGKFDLKGMTNFANENKLLMKETTIKSLKDNAIFGTNLIKRIFETKDNQTNLVTDSKFSKNFLIYVKKTEYKSFDKNSDEFKNYKIKARLDFQKKIYNTYDKSINSKYNIDINNNALERIKNSL